MSGASISPMTDQTAAEFLAARLDEDAARFDLAAEAEAESLRHDGMPDTTAQEIKDYWLRPGRKTEWPRWLDEIAVKREILADYKRLLFNDPLRRTDYFRGQREALGFVVQRLAQPYADHPDYREEWKP